MKLITGTNKGFFALSSDTARHISHCISNDEDFYIKWGTETLYYDSQRGDNVWEYFYKQPFSLTTPHTTVSDYIDLIKIEDSSFRETMNYIYSRYFILNEFMDESLKPSYSFFESNKVLGVHIRRTDKFLIGSHGTTVQQSPVDLELFEREIDDVVDDYDTIFLATDCQDACMHFKQRYGKKLIFNKTTLRGTGSQAPHSSFRNVSGFKKGFDVLSDVIYLSKCRHLIRSSSNVSVTALYLNLNLTQTNLNVKYFNDNDSDVL